MNIVIIRFILISIGIFTFSIVIFADHIGFGGSDLSFGAMQKIGLLCGLMIFLTGFLPFHSINPVLDDKTFIHYFKNKFFLLFIIILLFLIPDPFNFSEKTNHFQNYLHIPAFSLISFFMLQIFNKLKLPVYIRTFFPLYIATVFSLSSEVLQEVLPGRSASLNDIKLNFIGIFIGVFIFFILRRSKLA